VLTRNASLPLLASRPWGAKEVSELDRGWHTGELLGFDLETTGVRRHGDVPVSFALVRIVNAQVVERVSRIVDPGREIPEAATAVHGITTEHARREGIHLEEALSMLADALIGAGQRGVPVVGMNLAYDLSMLDHQLRLTEGRGLRERGWNGPVLDVLVLDRHFDRFRPGKRRLRELCEHYDVALSAAHEAGSDALAALAVLLALCDRFPSLLELELSDLTRLQAEWHRDWAGRHHQWLTSQGRRGLSPADADWPLARAQSGSSVPPG
jgi:DNA polymerase-3 subunit epsilon